MKLTTHHKQWIEEAAANLIAVADDSGESLVDVIVEMERYIMEETKVGGEMGEVEIEAGQRGYQLVNGRLVEAGTEGE